MQSNRVVGKIMHAVTGRGFFFIEVKNPETGELSRYFGLLKNVVRQYPDDIERGCPVRFIPESDFKPSRPEQLPLATQIEIFWSGTHPVANPQTENVEVRK
jgi:hypothetical protein